MDSFVVARYLSTGNVKNFLCRPEIPINQSYEHLVEAFNLPVWSGNSCFLNTMFAVFFAAPKNRVFFLSQLQQSCTEIIVPSCRIETIKVLRQLVQEYVKGKTTVHNFRKSFQSTSGNTCTISVGKPGDRGDTANIFSKFYNLIICSKDDPPMIVFIVGLFVHFNTQMTLFNRNCPIVGFEYQDNTYEIPTMFSKYVNNDLQIQFEIKNEKNLTYTFNSLTYGSEHHVVVVVQKEPQQFVLYDDFKHMPTDKAHVLVQDVVYLKGTDSTFFTLILPPEYVDDYHPLFLTYTLKVL